MTAIRGSGGNFGVVTEFVFNLHPVGPMVTAGVIAWPATQAAAVLDLFRRLTASALAELTTALIIRNAPPAPWLPLQAHGSPIIALLACHSGSPTQAEADLAEVRSHGRPLADAIQVKQYVAQQSMLDATQPAGLHYYWKSEFLATLDDDLLRACQTHGQDNTSPANQILLFHLGGQLNARAPDDGAVGNRDAAYACIVQASWPGGDPAQHERRAWVRHAWPAIQPHSTGGNYINFQTDDEGADRTRDSYQDDYRRLAVVKAACDPTNLFRVNRNIPPG